jgi:AraC-like DNA-binding protein
LWGEIFHRAESLIPLIYLVISAYIVYLCILRKELPFKERQTLIILSLTVSGIFILQLLRMAMPYYEGFSGFVDVKPLLAANLIQLFLPIHVYNKVHLSNKEINFKFYTLTPLLALALNVILIMFLSNYSINSGKALISTIILISAINLSIILFSVIKLFQAIPKYDANVSQKFLNDAFLLILAVILSLIYIFYIVSVKVETRINGFEVALSLVNYMIIIKLLYPYIKYHPIETLIENESTKNSHPGERRIGEEGKNEEIRDRLIQYFETEKPYLRSDITIQEVSLYLYTNKTYISRVINDSYGHNFNQFVNYYRIEEAKRLFFSDTKLSIQQLCDLSGFGSMATFTIAFRFYVGRSPADWCKDQKMKIYHEKESRH